VKKKRIVRKDYNNLGQKNVDQPAYNHRIWGRPTHLFLREPEIKKRGGEVGPHEGVKQFKDCGKAKTSKKKAMLPENAIRSNQKKREGKNRKKRRAHVRTRFGSLDDNSHRPSGEETE